MFLGQWAGEILFASLAGLKVAVHGRHFHEQDHEPPAEARNLFSIQIEKRFLASAGGSLNAMDHIGPISKTNVLKNVLLMSLASHGQRP